jgi:hypothetical protein
VAGHQLNLAPNIPRVKISSKFLAGIFVFNTAPSPLIIFQMFKLPTFQHVVLLVSSVVIEGKTSGKYNKGFFCSFTKLTRLTGQLQPKKLAYLGFQCLDHTAHTPYLAPSDYHLFSGLQKQLKPRHFSSDTDIATVRTQLDGKNSDFEFLE